MKRKESKLINAKEKTYKTLQLAIHESGMSLEELGEKIGSSRQSLTTSINRNSFRLETLYTLELILKKKIVFSQFDIPGESTEVLKAKIDTLEGVIKEFATVVLKSKK